MKKFFLCKYLLSIVDLNVQRNQGTAHYLLAAKGSNEHLADLPFKWYFIEVFPS